MRWVWTRKFGWDIVNTVCTAVGKLTPHKLIGLPTTTEIAAWNTEASKPLTGHLQHPFDTSDKPLLSQSFFGRYNIESDVATGDIGSTVEFQTTSDKEEIWHTARGTTSKQKKKGTEKRVTTVC